MRDGMGIREIARRFLHSRRKVREVLRGAGEPRSYPRRQSQSAPRLGPFHESILQILSDDKSQPPKQRHTAMRIFERLRDEQSYAGGYDAVRRFVKKHRTDKRETFIPLDPGQRLEADFGKIYVDFPEERRQVSELNGTVAWHQTAYVNCRLAGSEGIPRNVRRWTAGPNSETTGIGLSPDPSSMARYWNATEGIPYSVFWWFGAKSHILPPSLSKPASFTLPINRESQANYKVSRATYGGGRIPHFEF